MTRKSRNLKHEEYVHKYSHIPVDFKERLNWLYDTLHISETQAFDILAKRDSMINSLKYYDTNIILFEVPEGAPRPRFRLINRKNLANMAMANPNFVHVYSPTGREDQVFMKRLVTQEDFNILNQMICTPCMIDINAYLKTPAQYSKEDTIIAEIGLIRPIVKPDWDNLCKKYSDMFNMNVWLDDTLVIDGSIHRYYSVLPRIEIRLRYLNMVYNKQQYLNITGRANYDELYDLRYYGME